MASRILERYRPFYAFSFTGGEPVLHPFLPDIVRFVLTSRRRAAITIETTGAAEPDYYERLMAGVPRGSIRLSCASHPAWHDGTRIKALYEITKCYGQFFHFRLMLNPGDPATRSSVEFLSSLISDPSVSHEIRRLPDFREFSFPVAPRPSQGASSLEIETSFKLEREARQLASMSNKWCVRGVNFLQITPDGYCHGSADPVVVSSYPLWHEAATLPPAEICPCASLSVPGGLNNLLPRFNTREEAETFLKDYASQQAIWEFDAPLPRRGVDSENMDDREIVRARLKRHVSRASGMLPCSSTQPNLSALRLNDIVSIYGKLQDSQSRMVLMCAIAAMQTGTLLSDIPPGEDLNISHETSLVKGHSTFAELADLGFAIRSQWPALDIILPADGNDFIDSISWLIKELPEHAFRLFAQGGKVCLRACLPPTPWPAPVFGADCERIPTISVLLACRNVQNHIGRSIDSVLIQKIDNLEIIVVDDASDDATWDVVELRRKDVQHLFKAVRLSERVGLGKAMDLAFEQARGKYLLFLQPGETLSAGFLDCLCEEDAYGGADVLAGATALLGTESETVIRLEEGNDSLSGFLFAWSRGYSVSSCLVSRNFARSVHIRPMAAQGDINLHLGVQIFAGTPAVAQIADASVAMPACARLAVGESSIQHLISSLGYLRRLSDDCKIPVNISEVCEQHLYSRYLDQALNQINEDESLLSELAPLVRYPGIVRSILLNIASQFCEQRYLKPVVPASEREWRKCAAAPVPSFNMEAYGGADSPGTEIPQLTIVFYNRNGAGALERSIDSVLNQSMRDYEVFVMDDGSGDGSWEILQDYADFDSAIRLYRSDRSAGRGWHNNFAYNRARGRWLLFMDSSDLLDPGILQAGIEACQTTNPDLCIYTLQHILPNDEISWRQFILDGRKTTDEAWRLYETGELSADSPCVFYKNSFTRASGCSFGEFVNRPKDYFFAKALRNARNITTWDRIGAKKIVKQDYNLPLAEISYKAINSALRLQAFLADLVGRVPYGELNPASVSFKNMLLPALQALYSETGELPLALADYKLIADTPSILLELMRDYASQNAWELSRPAPAASPKAQNAQRPLVCIFWKGEDRDLARNLVNFSTQHLRQWVMLATGNAKNGLPEDLADLRIIPLTEATTVPDSVQYVSFADYGSYFEPGDLLRASALLERRDDIDFVCIMEASPFRIDAKPGEYAGVELLALHLDEQTAPMHWQACVFRREFLETNSLDFADSPAGGELLLIKALLKARKVRLLLPEQSHARRLRLKPGPGAAQRLRDVAREISCFFESSPFAGSVGCGKLVLKFMDECNLKPVLAHEIEELTSGKV